MIERELGRICQFHEYKKPKSLREIINNCCDVVEIVKKRIDDVENNRLSVPEVRQRKNIYPRINGKDIRYFLINSDERNRFFQTMRRKKDKQISPYFLLYAAIRTNKIRYKGKFLRDYFSSNDEYLLAASRIKHGWSVERAIAEKGKVYSFHENGCKGVEGLRKKLGFRTKAQAMFWLKQYGYY